MKNLKFKLEKEVPRLSMTQRIVLSGVILITENPGPSHGEGLSKVCRGGGGYSEALVDWNSG